MTDFFIQRVKQADESSVMELAEDIGHLAHHRSRQRIQSLGEVFTPEKPARQMLDMLDNSVWTDTGAVFFEPTCGHGNFVMIVAGKRLSGLMKKAKREKIERPHFYAVANTLNTLWAIDIDPENIKFCQSRVWTLVFNFLWSHEQRRLSIKPFIKKNKDFLVQALCCIEWQIKENEALSCLETEPLKAKLAAEKTAVSRKWVKEKGHRPINFEKTWAWRFQTLKSKGVIPFEYKKNSKNLDSLLKEGKQPVFDKKQKTDPSNLLTFPQKEKKEEIGISRHKKSRISDFQSFVTAA